MQYTPIAYAESYRVKHLEAQAEAWRQATRLADYLSAVRLQVEKPAAGQAEDDAEAWTTWVEGHLQRLKPLNTPPRLPKIPEPRSEDLKPFLHPAEQPLQRHLTCTSTRMMTRHNVRQTCVTCVTCVEYASRYRP
jgi:hypothetical protein